MSGSDRYSDTRTHRRPITLPIFLAMVMFASALLLAPASASAQTTSVVDDVATVITGYEAFARANNTYQTTGGHSDRGQGWFAYSDGNIYANKVSDEMVAGGYLAPDTWDRFEFLIYRCRDTVAVFAKSAEPTAAADAAAWEGCTQYPIDRLGHSYYQVATPLSELSSSVVDDVATVIAGYEAFARANNTYQTTGGHSDRGQGWFAYSDGNIYANKVSDEMVAGGYLAPDTWDRFEFLIYRCRDTVAVFAKSTEPTAAADAAAWEGCTQYPIDRLGHSYYQVATPLDQLTAAGPEFRVAASALLVASGPYTHGPEVMVVRSCLAGNGRVDFNIVNVGVKDATYRIEFEGQPARQLLVESGDWWRNPITGRPDRSYDVVVKRDGLTVFSESITIACDSTVKDLTTPEINIVNACRADNGYLLFQFVNPRATRTDYVIVFEGVPNRSVRAEGHAGVVRAVTGRPDGTYRAQVRVGSTFVFDEQVQVNCDGPVIPPGETASCNGLRVTINMNTNGGRGSGTAGNDVILGTPGNDTINAQGGNDTICAGAGDDKIVGGAGADWVDGGPGDDSIDTNSGNDSVFGAEGDDLINTGADDDQAWGGPGIDSVEGASGNDVLNGGTGNDWLLGGTGNDVVNGNAGQDWVAAYEGADVLNGGKGNDLLYDAQPTSGSAQYNGGDGNDYFTLGDAGGDLAYGGDGNDTFYGGLGQDRVFGEAGDDTMMLSHGDDYGDGGPGDDYLRGGPGSDYLTGQGGNDRISGLDDSQYYPILFVVDTSADTDQLFGGPGNDIFHGNQNTDPIIDGGGGFDQIPPQPSAGPVPVTGPEAITETADFHWEPPVEMGVTNTDAIITFTQNWHFTITNGPASGTGMAWEVHRADPAGASSDWVRVATGTYPAGPNGSTNFVLPGAVTSTLDPHGAFLLRVFTADGSSKHFGSYVLNFGTTELKPFDFSNLPPNNLGIDLSPHVPDPAHDPNVGTAIDPISPAYDSATNPNDSNPNGALPIGYTGPDDMVRPECPTNPDLTVGTGYWDKVKVRFDQTGAADRLDDDSFARFQYELMRGSSSPEGVPHSLPTPLMLSGTANVPASTAFFPRSGEVETFAEGFDQWKPSTMHLFVVDGAGNRTWCDSSSFTFPDSSAPLSGGWECHTLEVSRADDPQQCRRYFDNAGTESLFHMLRVRSQAADIQQALCWATGLIPFAGAVASTSCYFDSLINNHIADTLNAAGEVGFRNHCVVLIFDDGDLRASDIRRITNVDTPNCGYFHQPRTYQEWIEEFWCPDHPGGNYPSGTGTC